MKCVSAVGRSIPLWLVVAGPISSASAQQCLDCSGTPPVTNCIGDYSVCGRWVAILDCPTPAGQTTPPWPNCWPVGVKAVHAVLTHTGRVLAFGGTLPASDCFWNSASMAHLWHPGEFNVSGPQDNIMVYSSDQPSDQQDLFCSGHAVLPDGKVIFVGGTDQLLTVTECDSSCTPLSFSTSIPQA